MGAPASMLRRLTPENYNEVITRLPMLVIEGVVHTYRMNERRWIGANGNNVKMNRLDDLIDYDIVPVYYIEEN